jgi:uncharacterized protein YlzI (FlbEa/FlbD family)
MFLKLTNTNGQPVWINPEWIAYMESGNDITNIHLGVGAGGGLKTIHTKETMSEIELLIDEAYIEDEGGEEASEEEAHGHSH